ncbi:unnamed protein product [Rotaria sp. Silwood2]|nr:unnamed protein product [Rotaria sp. Silwood2]CAF2801176.1 unnamed protein product [Rotaria sp. Silwood2]CAF2958654.1 unnamed protein product [Rotaria sp. Silwood2]CAF3944506.1 unnamed protein product [Rotaria sp. Silwood2]
MTTKTDDSIPPPTAHAPQYYADFGTLTASNINEQLPPPPAYTALSMPSTENTTENMKPFTNPSTVVNELVNQRFSPTTQRRLNSQQILRITQYIDNQEKMMNDKLVAALCLSIVGIAAGITCIILFAVFHKDSCGYYQRTSSCVRTYSALIIGCISIVFGILRITIYGMAKRKISHAKKLWQEKVAQLQQTSLNGY